MLGSTAKYTSVAVSGRFTRSPEPTGTHRSARGLLSATVRAGFTDITLLGLDSSHELADLCEVKTVRFRNAIFDHLWEQFVFPLALPGRVLWTLLGTGPVFHGGKQHVMVVHDLNFQILPDVFSKVFRVWYQFACARAAYKANAIICFTHYVKETICHRLGIPSEKIHVVPQGPGLIGLETPIKPAPAAGMQIPYFLCVGSLQPHKNLAGVLKAWRIFRASSPGYVLKVVGRPQTSFTATGVDASDLSPDVEFMGYLDDAELVRLYRAAAGFLYPSFEEGFGLPIVEAFYCGCPVITSNCSCLPEVAGNAAMLVDPNDPKELARAMSSLVTGVGVRQKLQELGYARAQFYRWEAAGKQTAAILRQVVSSHA